MTEAIEKLYRSCNLCPRKCGVDRRKAAGFCGAGAQPRLARAALHYWEEPCISGTHGSGTVFFSHCNLKCVYCQNREISTEGFGKDISDERLCEIFLNLQAQGAHNINLVTPTPWLYNIINALDMAGASLKIPIVYNCGGYESPEVLQAAADYIDIFLTDIKYFSDNAAREYSHAENYFNTSLAAAQKMIELTDAPKKGENGILQKGTIIRHLVLPGMRADSKKIIDEICRTLTPGSFIFSLMSQYTPNSAVKRTPGLCRRVSSFEYNDVLNYAVDKGLTTGYMQSRTSAKEEYTPPFDLTGV